MTESIVRHSMGGSTVQKSKIIVGDCLDKMREMETNSVDSIVTDPPYGLSFMGKDWDHGVPGVPFWREALRVLKPGGHLLAFGGSRTYHRLVCAIEDAGFEIRDQIMWLYGSGFPKSKNLDGDWQGWGTALKPAHEPICVARKRLEGTVAANVLKWGTGAINVDGCRVGHREKPKITDPKHGGHSHNAYGAPSGGGKLLPDARWPANVIHDGSDEVLAGFPEAPGQQGNLIGHSKDRKSPNGCFGKMGPARNHMARVESNKSAARFFKQCEMGDEDWHHQQKLDHLARNAASRSEQCETHIAAEAAEIKTSGSKSEASQAIPGSTGNCESCTQIRSHAQSAAVMENTDTTQITASPSKSSGFAHHVTGESTNLESKGKVAAGSGPEVATRFVYCPKASKKDRGEGNGHPTVKPTDLMRYLCRLVTPPGGVVLDPFCGSGSTGKAAVLEGFRFIGIELSEEYAVIGEARIADASNVMKITAKEEKQLSFL